MAKGVVIVERQMNLEIETDGKKYALNDMVRVGCNDCAGCHKCCTGMGNSIVLDPLDFFRLCKNVPGGMNEVLSTFTELNVFDGIILPNIKMNGKDACAFLNEEGRCSIHPFRPGICRIFPLGRLYEEGKFSYILQVNECPHPDKTKVKVGKWIDSAQVITNQNFINDWHYMLKNVSQKILEANEEAFTKRVDMAILNTFFISPYLAENEADFYAEFGARMAKFKEEMEL